MTIVVTHTMLVCITFSIIWVVLSVSMYRVMPRSNVPKVVSHVLLVSFVLIMLLVTR